MNGGDFPSMESASHTHTIYGLNNMATPLSTVQATTAAGSFPWSHEVGSGGLGRQAQFVGGVLMPAAPAQAQEPKPKKAKEKPVTRRLVQVFIADPDDNLPLERSMLYSGEQKLTDATDQELFFEIDMKAILQKHNEERVTTVNKKVKERVEYLEPAKIRDLKMVVVNVATF